MKTTLLRMSFAGAVGFVSVGIMVSGCNQAPPRAEPPAPKVAVAHPEMRKLTDYDQYNGWLKAVDSVDIRSRVRGHLQKIDFTDGDMVKKGQLLFELDPRTFEAEIGRANDQVKIYEAQKVASAKELARFKELLPKGGASQSQIDTTEAQTQALEAQIEAAKQEAKRRELDLEYSRITSPIDGRIGRSILSVGSLVNAMGSEEVLATIVSVDPIYVYFNIDERSLQRYMTSKYHGAQTQPTGLRQKKVPFRFALETETGYPHEGVLDFADNRVDSSTGTIEVRGVVPNEKQMFVSGARVSIRVPVSEEHEVLLVPDTAVLTDQNKKYVLTLDDKKVVQRRDIEPGKLLDDRMRVVRQPEGGQGTIKPEDWIITQGLQMARINYPVEPIMPGAAAPAGGTGATQPASQPAVAAVAK